MPGPELARRVAVASVGIPFGIAVFYFGTWPTTLVLAVVGALGAQELYRIAAATGARPLSWLGIPAAVALVLGAALSDGVEAWSAQVVAVALVVTLGALAAAVFVRGPGVQPLNSVAITLLGALYVGATLGFAAHLRAFPGVSAGEPGWPGALIAIFPLTVAWVGDSAAYFAGHRWGRTKLIPSVSPGKTVAGSVGGLVGSAVTAVVFTALLLNPYSGLALSLFAAGFVGLVVGAAGQIGDLAESLIKRGAGVKDSGALFPGHGGVLDRFDSIFFALPVTYFLLQLFVRG